MTVDQPVDTTANPTDLATVIPDGFKLRQLGAGFMDANGPLYYRRSIGSPTDVTGGIVYALFPEAPTPSPDVVAAIGALPYGYRPTKQSGQVTDCAQRGIVTHPRSGFARRIGSLLANARCCAMLASG